MEISTFVENTVCKVSSSIFERLKEMLISDLITFSILKENRVSAEILAEKICDYFSMIECKTGRTFDKQIESFMTELDAVTAPRIAKIPQAKKGDPHPVIIPRARKYYDRAIKTKAIKELTVEQLIDYTRIMTCLYLASTDADDKIIDDFNFDSRCIELTKTIDHLKKEEIQVLFPPSKRKRFESKDRYSLENCFLVLMIIALCTIINDRNQGGKA